MNVRIPSTAAGGGGLTDAPSDGNQYARKNGSWDVVLGGGGSAYAEVNTFADLPSAASNSGVTYLVRTAQGVIFVNRKPKGLYRSDGSIWERLDDESEAYFQDTLAWTNITSKPSTFPPIIGSGAGDAVAGNDSRLTDARTPTTHSHAQSDITNLVSDLAAKAASSHTHAYSSLTSIPSTFAPSAHTHAATDIGSGTLDGDRLPGLSSSKKGGVPATGTPSGKYLKDDGTWDAPSGGGTQYKLVTAIFDGGGSAISAGSKCYVRFPWAGTITKVTTLADVSGSAVVDVWKDTYANYPPTVADTIAAAAKPTLSTATKSEDSTLTGWTTAIAAGDVLGFNVDSCTTITRLVVEIEVTL